MSAAEAGRAAPAPHSPTEFDPQPPPPDDELPSEWELADDDEHHSADHPEDDTATRARNVIYLSEWQLAEDNESDEPATYNPPPLPSRLRDRNAPHVILDLDPPAAPYVTADPAGVHGKARDGCMKSGPVLIRRGPRRGFFQFPTPCGSTTCLECGPARHHAISDDMAKHWPSGLSIFLHAIEAPDLDGIRSSRRKVCDTIRSRGGEYLWFVLRRGDRFVCVVFSDVDHSARSYRGQPPRSVDRISGAEALLYVEHLLYHGLHWDRGRRSSKDWPLSDVEPRNRSTPPGSSFALGNMTPESRRTVWRLARDLYHRDDWRPAELRGRDLPQWSDDDDMPPRSVSDDDIELLLIHANDRRKADQSGCNS